jgi:hypothetical protein
LGEVLAMNLTKAPNQKYFSKPDHRTISRLVSFQNDQGGIGNCIAVVEVA